MNMVMLAALLSAGTALTNSTAETVLQSHSLAADTLLEGKILKLHAVVRATATNSTDTLEVKVRVGPTTLTGTVCATSGAVDVADNNVCVVDLELAVRTGGASAVVVVSGLVSALGAEGTAAGRVAFELLSIDATAAQKIELTGTWGSASSSDSCKCEAFTLIEMVG